MKLMKEKWHCHLDLLTPCPISCAYCSRFIKHHDKKHHFVMSVEDVINGLESLQGFPGRIGMMGGEPANYPYLEELCHILQDPKWASEQYPNVRDRFSFFTSGGPLFEKHKALIYATFQYVEVNEHNAYQESICMHQPLTLCAKDVAPDEDMMWKWINNCPFDKNWCLNITPKGAFFCEIASAIDRLMDGPGGFKVEKGWWNKGFEDDEYWEQVERYCTLCGGCVPIHRETIAETGGKELISPTMLEILTKANSHAIKRGEYRLFDRKLTYKEVEDALPTWRPCNFRADLRDPLCEC